MKVAIIGTSQSSSHGKLTEELFSKMVARCEEELLKLDSPAFDLVSGGAAWGDHLAVILFLKSRMPDYHVPIKSLSLYLPAYFDRANGKFYDGYYGDIVNKRHREFSLALTDGSSRETLSQINTAIAWKAKVYDNFDGFGPRNMEVGKVEAVLAFTFGAIGLPSSPGTLFTWESSPAPTKIHISLSSL